MMAARFQQNRQAAAQQTRLRHAAMRRTEMMAARFQQNRQAAAQQMRLRHAAMMRGGRQ